VVILTTGAIRVATAVVLLVALPACSVTFRRKPIVPIDNDRNYNVSVQTCWDTAKKVVTDFSSGVEEEDFDPQNTTGLLVTRYAVFSDSGENDWQYLREVVYSQGAPFIGGRYQLTLTTRTVRGGACKVRVVARIEGYMGEEYGYQALRSTGLLEQEIFDRISAGLGAEPVGN
jgi:hypothetical protein|tara:strand:+ start:3102 stop:3620 length:519 start_codon:yes stop_codon:yes gene_type:complete